VGPGETLFVHSGLQAAMRVAGRRPAEKMATIVEGLAASVPEGVVAMPTFTYSFTEGEVFDPAETPSTVGALTEFFRGRGGVRRTLEPNFSCALDGEAGAGWSRLFEPGDTDAFGDNGIFGFLRERRARLLFFGVGFEYCTYVHHVEQRLGVPYRYFKDFPGVVRHEGEDHRVTARYFVRRLEEDVVPSFDALADELLARERMLSRSLPRGPRLLLTDAAAVEEVAADCVAADPDFLLTRGASADEGPGGQPERMILPGS
jgi:aminoglycoside 3-N-acetyltransferase